MNSKILSNQTNFIRPKLTFQDTIQKNYQDYLNGYDDVLDISKVPLETHLRYISIDKNNKKVFRLGGFLKFKNKDYIVLGSSDTKWSVPIRHYNQNKDKVIFETIFFKKITKDEKIIKIINKLFTEIKNIKEKLKIDIDDFEDEIENDLNDLYSDLDINDTEVDTESDITSIESIQQPKIIHTKPNKTPKNKKKTDFKPNDDESINSIEDTPKKIIKNKTTKNKDKIGGTKVNNDIPVNIPIINDEIDYEEGYTDIDEKSIMENDEQTAGVNVDDDFSDIAKELSKRITNNKTAKSNKWVFMRNKKY